MIQQIYREKEHTVNDWASYLEKNHPDLVEKFPNLVTADPGDVYPIVRNFDFSVQAPVFGALHGYYEERKKKDPLVLTEGDVWHTSSCSQIIIGAEKKRRGERPYTLRRSTHKSWYTSMQATEL